MKVIVYTERIVKNIRKAYDISGFPISLMFKDFYEHIYTHISSEVNNQVFGLNIKGSSCYSIGKATSINSSALVTSVSDAVRYLRDMNINSFYIPINACDNREGLGMYEAAKLVKDINSINGEAKLRGMITSGCISESHPPKSFIQDVANKIPLLDGISLGGSFWLDNLHEISHYVSDIRIGEYMLFGTIPYSDSTDVFGYNGIEIEAKVIGVYPDRNNLIVDCGYSMADIDKCKCCDDNLTYVNISSEYSIFRTCYAHDYMIGDTVRFIPDYKSLVKLRYADTEYR